MFAELNDTTRLAFNVLSGLIFIAGVTVSVWLIAQVQTRRLVPSLPANRRLKRTPFTAFQVHLAMAATLVFALMAAFQEPSPTPPPELALIIGPIIYAATAATVVILSLVFAQASFRRAFLGRRGSGWNAFKKGILYGIAAIPPVLVISMCSNAACEALGFEPHQQEVFNLLADDSVSLSIRLFLIASAVLIAPLVEELLFRGILFTVLLKTRPFIFAALLSSAYFAVVHLHGPSFLPLLALSVAFSAGYAATGSLITPITMHMLFNLSSVCFYLSGAD